VACSVSFSETAAFVTATTPVSDFTEELSTRAKAEAAVNKNAEKSAKTTILLLNLNSKTWLQSI
jgi:hypothetical protein